MKPNVGGLDKKIRIAAGITIIAAGAFFSILVGSSRHYSYRNSID